MIEDAKFEDGAEKPVKLLAQDADDLQIISALCQDAVMAMADVSWSQSKRQFGILLNRFRWEDKEKAQGKGRNFERVRSVFVIDSVLKVKSSGVDHKDKALILSLLSIHFEPDQDGSGTLVLTLAGDGTIGLDVECVDVTLQDVTRPYIAQSKSAPTHDSE